MIRTRYNKVLLVAPEVFPDELLTDYKNVKHISSISRIFPSLNELNPDLVIFDYEFVGKDLEKILRRININTFYDKLKIYCFKSRPDEKTDGLLKALGVDGLIYQEDLLKPSKNKTMVNNFSAVLDSSILKWIGAASN